MLHPRHTGRPSDRQVPVASPQQIWRTPVDDCPPFDPSAWDSSTADVFYLTRRAMEAREKRRAETKKETLDLLAGIDKASKAVDDQRQRELAAIAAHLRPPCPPKTLLGRLLHYWFPPPPPPRLDLSVLSQDELTDRFRVALQSGNTGECGVYAQELARRKAKLHVAPLSEEHKNDGRGGNGAAAMVTFGRSLADGEAPAAAPTSLWFGAR